MKRSSLLHPLIAFTIGLMSSSANGELKFDKGGYVKSFFGGQSTPQLLDPNTDLEEFFVLNRARFKILGKFSETSNAEFAYDLAPSFLKANAISGSQSSGFSRSSKPRYRLVDFDPQLYPSETGADRAGRFVVFHNLDRLSFESQIGILDWKLGRQAISFGSARTINPTDFLVPFSYSTIDSEDRTGVDAIRLRFSLGTFSELDLGYVLGESFVISDSAAFARVRFPVLDDWDIALIATHFSTLSLVGLDLQFSIGEWGAWIEASQIIGPDAGFRISTGVDYQWNEEVYSYFEFHFNGLGEEDAAEYPLLSSSKPYSLGTVFLLNRFYLNPGLTYQISPLVGANLGSFINLVDSSMLLSPKIEYNLAEDIYLDVGAWFGIGSGVAVPGTPESEFGLFGVLAYTSIRFYY